MTSREDLVRLNAFEGLCLTAGDLVSEQLYHRQAQRRHARYLSGHGVVQGLAVELNQRVDRYEAVVSAGFGLARSGQGVHLPADTVVPLEMQEVDGDYVLWLLHVEREDPSTARPIYDTADTRPARIVESVEARLLPAEAEPDDGVAVARLRVRLGRMAHVHVPVPRAGRVERAAESWLKPRLTRYVELNRSVMLLLFRTSRLHELSIAAYGFYAALVGAEFLLIEEGTADPVLYRTAGSLVRHARTFFDADGVRDVTERIGQLATLLQAVDDAAPTSAHDARLWQVWFEQFERLLPPLERAVEELQATVEARSEGR